ncbi:MAG: NAD-binding protein [Candidatus Cloacimonetes bacterium]|nr:NAD-binding protein [Candidatus Cloacimonadota bacterium]
MFVFLDFIKSKSKDRSYLVFIWLVLLIILSSAGFYYFEHGSHENLSVWDCIWWSIVTMTTVGYGDLYPQSFYGRFLVGIPTMLLGIACLAIFLDKIQENLTKRSKKERGLLVMKEENHILILGYPGESAMLEIITELQLDSHLKGHSICFVTAMIDLIPATLKAKGVHFVHGNPSKLDSLEKANIGEAHKIIILVDDHSNTESDGVSLMRILNAKKALDMKYVYIIAECMDPTNEANFHQAGADEVIVTEALLAGLVVQGMASNGINPIIRDLITNSTGVQFYMDFVPASHQKKTFGDLVSKFSKSCSQLTIIGHLVGGKGISVDHSSLLNSGDKILYVSANRKELWM